VTEIRALINHRSSWKENKKTVVFTNGVFDILHRGHVEYLNSAKALGDILIIGLNSDESVRRLKGNLRPIVPMPDRLFVLENIKAVDHVVPFNEDTPLELIKALDPDILVKGGDYTIETIVDAEFVLANGGSVMPLPFIKGKSSTSILDIIINRYNKLGNRND